MSQLMKMMILSFRNKKNNCEKSISSYKLKIILPFCIVKFFLAISVEAHGDRKCDDDNLRRVRVLIFFLPSRFLHFNVKSEYYIENELRKSKMIPPQLSIKYFKIRHFFIALCILRIIIIYIRVATIIKFSFSLICKHNFNIFPCPQRIY